MAGAISSRLLNALRVTLGTRAAAEEMKALLQPPSDRLAGATFSIGTEAANAIVVSIQLTDEEGDDLTEATAVRVLLLADAAGAAFNANDYTVAAGTDGAVAEVVADKVLECISETDGDLDISLTITGAATCYVAVVMPNGNMVVSGAVTHA